MLQGVLQELEHDRDDCRQPPITEDERFAKVAETMGENEHIHLVPEIVIWILWHVMIINATIAAIVLLRDWLTQVIIDKLE
jgi:hypothetical protein